MPFDMYLLELIGIIRVNVENLSIESLKYIEDTMLNSYSCK